MMFADDKQISIKVPTYTFAIPKIYDWNYLILHGNDIKSWNSLPFYGLAKAGLQYFTTMAGDNVILHKIISGHIHQAIELPLSEDLEWWTSASWVPRDEYGFKLFRTYAKTVQRFWGVNPRRPSTWSFKIDLSKSHHAHHEEAK